MADLAQELGINTAEYQWVKNTILALSAADMSSQMMDESSAAMDSGYAQLKKQHDQPFLLACGLVKPHMAWSVPKKYFEMYPVENVQLPKVLETDLDDVPPGGVKMARPEGDHAAILQSGRWKDAVQAYLATITFCDAMVGRLIEGFDQSAYRDNTIICLWSDHGWHLGEKQHWRKSALWEEATRAPYIWVVPGSFALKSFTRHARWLIQYVKPVLATFSTIRRSLLRDLSRFHHGLGIFWP